MESGRFPWGNGRFPLMTEPVASYGGLSWWGNFGEYGFLTRLRSEQLRDMGASLSPFNAFLFLLGLETLALRMAAHVANARAVAAFLEAHPMVAWVNYAGLASSPWQERADRYLPEGPGLGVLLRAEGRPRRRRHLRRGASSWPATSPTWATPAPSSSTRGPRPTPSSTTPASWRPASAPDLIRISVGIEDPDDICRDLDQALSARRAGELECRRRHGSAAGPVAGHPDRGDGRRVAEPSRASNFVATYLLAETDYDGLVRQPHRRRDPRPARVPVARRPARPARHRRRVPPARRAGRRRRGGHRRRRLHACGSSSACGTTPSPSGPAGPASTS